MLTTDLLKKVRKIEIKTRRLSQNIFAGEYHSAFKGRGMVFSEVREYQVGDDVRDIDWNVTARFNKPFVKVFEEERELTVMLMIDVSGSLDFGTMHQKKRDTVAEIAATLAFSTILNNDKIGVIFFSDRVEKYIPPQKGRKHILHIIREILSFRPSSLRTNISQAVEYLARVQKRSCTIFLLSDFYAPTDFIKKEGKDCLLAKTLRLTNQKHDITAIQVEDIFAKRLPNIGLLKAIDAETGHELWIDTSSKKTRTVHERAWQERQEVLKNIFSKSMVDWTCITTGEDFVRALIILFKQKG